MPPFAAASMERRHRSQIFEKILREDSDPSHRPFPRPSIGKPAQPSPVPASTRPSVSLEECRLQGFRCLRHGDPEAAAVFFQKAVGLSDEASQSFSQRFDLLLTWAEALRKAARWENATATLEMAGQLLASAVPGSSDPQHADLLRARAALLAATGDAAGAEGCLIQAIDLCESGLGLGPRLCALHRDLARVYTRNGHQEAAISAALDSLHLAEGSETGDARERLATLQLLAGINHTMGACDAAANHLLEAYRIAEESDFQEELADMEAVLGTLYAQYGEDEAARDWLLAAVDRRVRGKPDASRELTVGLLEALLAQVEARLGLSQSGESFTRSVERQIQHLGGFRDS